MDIHEFFENHKYGVDRVKGGKYCQLEYFDFERGIMNHIIDNQFTIIKKSRQMHLSTLLATYSSKFLKDNFDSENKILYFSPKCCIGQNFIAMTKLNLQRYNPSALLAVDNKNELSMFQGNKVKSICSLNQFSNEELMNIHMIMIDEAAFVVDFDKIMTFIDNKLDDGKLNDKVKIVIVSSPNGFNSFFNLYSEADLGRCKFKPYSINYKNNPRFNNDEWLENMKRTYNYDERLIQQEIFGWFVKDEPKPKVNKNNLIQFRVDDELFRKISIKLIGEDITISNYIRKLITKDLKHE